ncbi:hypothetical protein G647_03573 [Cladophialophora carrionii CBS 160.54]|uniref:Extracellular membrane protein CFEM domain-containing protein n=1 Tax=Cladophialophora carrionii CBS 160.54 TaxID=1279043 RepID=V9DBB4_9EURO|nr:uncharacterized protein G647_03573 [Cladophialophora carrionii CBS 160.54]ETI24204.1 hypothetical protein G647_03573 [Cladophialophora carrionii CBS 160.54]
MKLLSTFIVTVSLVVGLAAAIPQTSSGGSGSEDEIPCPAVYPCIDWYIILEYCSNTTDPAVATGESFTDTAPIKCACGTKALGDESGLYAAAECILCDDELPDADATVAAQWFYTCYTFEESTATDALDCWNSGGTDCSAVPEKRKMSKRDLMKPNMLKRLNKPKVRLF